MSYQYDQYLQQHRTNVKRGFDWIRENLPHLVENNIDPEWQIEYAHDQSKFDPEEYAAYDAYFYGGNRSFSVVNEFRKAWLTHIHRNPHHWQHWILINDDPEEGVIIMEMPYNHLLEMICDWWAFSWVASDLKLIFSWYNEHKNHIKLHSKTRLELESILDQIKAKMEEEK